jgi:hypothetical protein
VRGATPACFGDYLFGNQQEKTRSNVVNGAQGTGQEIYLARNGCERHLLPIGGMPVSEYQLSSIKGTSESGQ